jgi:hypothetical protein
MPCMQLPRRAEPAPHEDYEPWEEKEEACNAADAQPEVVHALALLPAVSAALQPLACMLPARRARLHALLTRRVAWLRRCQSSRS